MAVNHEARPRAAPAGGDQAYRIVAELLVGFRRIVRRGLQRLHGETWLEVGCPADLLAALAARRDAEQAVERVPPEADDPLGDASFADLAAILDSNGQLEHLLRMFAGSPDPLSAELRRLEALRSKVAGGRSISEAERKAVERIHLGLHEKLASARQRGRPEEPALTERPPARPPVEPPAAEPTGAEPDHAAEPVTASPPATTGAATSTAPAASATGDATAIPPAPSAAGQRQGTRRPGAVSPAADEASRPVKPVWDPAGAVTLDGAPTPVGLVRVSDDDLAVLRELRREVIAAAEAAYAQAERIPMKVWTEAWQSGWYARRVEAYGLGEIATFYAIMEQVLERRGRGADGRSQRSFLADRELAKLLLRLRELFLRLKV